MFGQLLVPVLYYYNA